jgi:hypothetical protein
MPRYLGGRSSCEQAPRSKTPLSSFWTLQNWPQRAFLAALVLILVTRQ